MKLTILQKLFFKMTLHTVVSTALTSVFAKLETFEQNTDVKKTIDFLKANGSYDVLLSMINEQLAALPFANEDGSVITYKDLLNQEKLASLIEAIILEKAVSK